MAFRRVGRAGIEPGVQAWLRVAAAQLREKLYGPEGCPEWGTKFREIDLRRSRPGTVMPLIDPPVADLARRGHASHRRTRPATTRTRPSHDQ